ncbi:MAG: efflux RND transporter permease subunit, partial [Flavitalea sp.]
TPIFWVLVIFGVLFHLPGWHGLANFFLFMAILMIFHNYVLKNVIYAFQHRLLPSMMSRYEKLLRWLLAGKRPGWLFASLFGLFIISILALMVRKPATPFFPSGDPNIVFVYLKMPVGTSAETTDSTLRILEGRVIKVLGKEMPGNEGAIVESMISNVAVSANNPRDNNRSTQSNLGRIQVSFLSYEERHGKKTAPLMAEIRKVVQGIPGTSVEVAQEDGGPPTDPPVNIEIIGDNFENIAEVATGLKNFLDTNRVEGIENLQMDIDLLNPEITINVDRTRAMAEGLSTAQIGGAIRTAVFGKEVSKLKEGEDEYKIQLRLKEITRNDISALMNTRITFRDMATMQIKQVPLNAVASLDYTSTPGAINRKNVKRTIQLQSNVTDMNMTPVINEQLAVKIEDFKSRSKMPPDVTIRQSGESEQQQETMEFLGTSLIIALLMIFLILVLQFNSLSKPFIVLTEIFFSVIGVFLGFAITGMTMPTIMVGVGIVGLAGIVIKNGILLIEFTDELRGRGFRTREAAIQAGKIRIIPVMLTAIATMLGLFPLAVGFNIDFVSMFQHLDPDIFFGGDSVVFWGPLSWTIIFGLIFSFFLTLLMVPSMYIISERLRRPMGKFYGTKFVALFGFLGPLFFLFVGFMYLVRAIQGKKVWTGKLKPAPARV